MEYWNWIYISSVLKMAPMSLFIEEYEMEYLGLISFGVAVVVVGVRSAILLKQAKTPENEQEYYRRGATSEKAQRVQVASLAKNLLRYHLQFSRNTASKKTPQVEAASLNRKLLRYHAGLSRV
jgi:hypothetical protein